MTDLRSRPPAPVAHIQDGGVHLRWLLVGLLVGFGVPFVFADLLGLPRDVYYGIHAAATVALFLAWAGTTGQPLGTMLRRRWPVAITLGLAFAVVMAVMVVRVEDSTPRPDGLELAGAVVWRGVVYGASDGLLLSAFPILVVFAAFAGTRLRRHRGGALAVGVLALLASMVMTAVYHAGYREFRSEKVAQPVAGSVAWSVPTLATLNPVGSPITHAGMHVAAVLHSYDTDVFLPPHD